MAAYSVRLYLGPGNSAQSGRLLEVFEIDEHTGVETEVDSQSLAGTTELSDVELMAGRLYRICLTSTYEGGSTFVTEKIRAREEQFDGVVRDGKFEALSIVGWDDLSSSSSSSSLSSSSDSSQSSLSSTSSSSQSSSSESSSQS